MEKFHEPEYLQYLSQFTSVRSQIVNEYQHYNQQPNITHFTSHIYNEFDLLDYNLPHSHEPIETNNNYP